MCFNKTPHSHSSTWTHPAAAKWMHVWSDGPLSTHTEAHFTCQLHLPQPGISSGLVYLYRWHGNDWTGAQDQAATHTSRRAFAPKLVQSLGYNYCQTCCSCSFIIRSYIHGSWEAPEREWRLTEVGRREWRGQNIYPSRGGVSVALIINASAPQNASHAQAWVIAPAFIPNVCRKGAWKSTCVCLGSALCLLMAASEYLGSAAKEMHLLLFRNVHWGFYPQGFQWRAGSHNMMLKWLLKNCSIPRLLEVAI